MSNYLVDHALQNVWCSPEQDNQHIVRPARISALYGVWNKVQVGWRTYVLPNVDQRFHVYQIGQLYPILLGLFPQKNTWVSLAECINEEHMLVEAYSSKGIKLPNQHVWYRFTEDRNLVFAIPEQAQIPFNLVEEDVYLRVYTPAYFSSAESDPKNDYIYTEGITATDVNSIVAFQIKINQYIAKPGKVLTYSNGYLVSSIDPFTAKKGDLLEFVYDSSIYKVVEFPIKNLPVFNSTMDEKRKYLLHPLKSAQDQIDFLDDVDFFLYKPDTNGRYKGVYYHKNLPGAVRMITHHDYSIMVENVVALNNGVPGWTDPEELILRLYLRKSGYKRPLVFDANRIRELYKLTDTAIQNAMLGIDSSVLNWEADTLEQSAYCAVMRSPDVGVTPQLVQDAYGYNAISKLIGDTPNLAVVESGLKLVHVPYLLQHRGVVFEYDSNGYLLGYYPHFVSDVYVCTNTTTAFVEMFSGVMSKGLDEYYDQPKLLEDDASYRYYASPVEGGVNLNQWADVTGSAMYSIVQNEALWVVSPDNYRTVIRSDKKILCYDINLTPYDGILHFSLTQEVTKDNITTTHVMRIPPGEIDLFLNGRPLIEDLDYFIQFPQVYIVAKKYLVNPETQAQKVTVRAKGFCKSDLTREVAPEVGFVQYGMLSKNNRFDLHDDKVQRIVVGGAVKLKSDLTLFEDHSGISVGATVNGLPYQIKDIVIPMRGNTPGDTYDLRAQAQVVDKRVSDYLTLHLPEYQFTTPFSIPELYPVYSPFFTKLLYDLLHQVLIDPRIYSFMNDQDVYDITASYEYLLAFDPCSDEHFPDENFVIIHPHPLNRVMDVDAFQYRFLASVARLVLKDRVNLSHFLRIV